MYRLLVTLPFIVRNNNGEVVNENSEISTEFLDLAKRTIDDFNNDEFLQNLIKDSSDSFHYLPNCESVRLDRLGKFLMGEFLFSERPSQILIDKTTDWLNGQCSDGWGEGFEQKRLRDGYSVSTWNSSYKNSTTLERIYNVKI